MTPPGTCRAVNSTLSRRNEAGQTKKREITVLLLRRTEIQAGSSMSPQICYASNVHEVFDDRPRNLTGEFYGPLLFLPVTVLFFRQTFFFLYFAGILGLRRSKIPGKKEKKEKIPPVNGLGGTHKRRVRTMSIYLKKQRGHLEFCAENMCNLRRCL